MKTRIDQLLKGEFDYSLPELLFSEEKIYVSITPGDTYQGEVYLGAEDGRKIRGSVTSSNRRLVPAFSELSGTTVRLPFGVDGIGMKHGEKINEWLCFTTSIGEYRLPVIIEAKKDTAGTSAGEIRTPEELAILASDNFREAYRVFTSPAMNTILSKCSGHQLSVYEGIAVPPVTLQSLEEYLCALKLKEKVSFRVSDDKKEITGIKESMSDFLRITRSGWGHLRLEIEAAGDFISLEKRVLTDEDFIGSTCILNFVIHAGRLGNGNNFGRISISSPYEKKETAVIASRRAASVTSQNSDVRMAEKKRRLDLAEDYLDYRTGRTEKSAWIVSGHYELNRLKETGCEYPEYLLLEAFMLLEEDKPQKASEVLARFRDKSYAKEDMEMAGVYLYLCVRAGLYKDKAAAISRISSFFHQKGDSLWLCLVLINFDPDYISSPSKALVLLEDLFDCGVRSPFMYLAALVRLRRDESLLRHMNRFWTQVFLFGAKRGYLTEELAMRFSYLCRYEKQYAECLYRALVKAYESHGLDDTLEAICRYIMLDNPRKKEYFRWYSLAVEKGIRLTRLYEYYMETLDTSYRRPLPRPVLMYFNYNNNSLFESRKAWLYAVVTENREADPESFESYRGIIEEFARARLKEGKINEDLAILYRHFITAPEDSQEAEALSDIAFCRRAYCDSKEIRSIVVKHRQLRQETVYPVVRGEAYPRIYTPDAAIIFVDSRQRRFASTVEHTIKPLLDEKLYVRQSLDKGAQDPGLLLSFCEGNAVRAGNLRFFKEAAASPSFTTEYKDEIRHRILEFYRTDIRGESMELNIDDTELREYAMADRKGLLEVLTMRGMYEEAFRIIEEFGTEDIDPSALLLITRRMIRRYDMEEDDELVALATEVYNNGTYDETILQYLMEHRNGPVDELIKILKSARGFDMETYAFEEKLLGILMLTQDYRKEGEAILEHYSNSSGKERVIGAYLTQASYGYVVRDYNISAFERTVLERAWRRKWPVDRICRIALFKAIVREKDPKGRYAAMKKELLAECQDYGYVFSFFQRLPDSMLSLYQLDDKTIVECHADPEASVTLHYRIETGLLKEPSWREKPVSDMYEGVFTAMFTLFYGDTLKYFFEIEKDGRSKKTAERTIRMNQPEGIPGSRYQLINHLLSCHRLGRDKEAQEGLRQYLRQQQFVEDMFVPEEKRYG